MKSRLLLISLLFQTTLIGCHSESDSSNLVDQKSGAAEIPKTQPIQPGENGSDEKKSGDIENNASEKLQSNQEGEGRHSEESSSQTEVFAHSPLQVDRADPSRPAEERYQFYYDESYPFRAKGGVPPYEYSILHVHADEATDLDYKIDRNSGLLTTGQKDAEFLIQVRDSVGNTSNSPLCKIRIHSGSQDLSFGTFQRGPFRGTTNLRGDTSRILLGLGQNDSILVMNHRNKDDVEVLSDQVILSKYKADGKSDLNFGTLGRVFIWERRVNLHALEMRVDGAGNVFALIKHVPREGARNQESIKLHRFSSDGKKDLEFGNYGEVNTGLKGSKSDVVMALQPNGKILIGGKFQTEAGEAFFALKRLNEDGSFDLEFGENGLAHLPFSVDSENSLIIQTLDEGLRITIAGHHSVDGNEMDLESQRIALLRFNGDGHPDTTFGPQGLRLYSEPESRRRGKRIWERYHALLPQRQGKVLVVGYAWGTPYAMKVDKNGNLKKMKKLVAPVLGFSKPPRPGSTRIHLTQLQDQSVLVFEKLDATSSLYRLTRDLKLDPTFSRENERVELFTSTVSDELKVPWWSGASFNRPQVQMDGRVIVSARDKLIRLWGSSPAANDFRLFFGLEF